MPIFVEVIFQTDALTLLIYRLQQAAFSIVSMRTPS